MMNLADAQMQRPTGFPTRKSILKYRCWNIFLPPKEALKKIQYKYWQEKKFSCTIIDSSV